MKHYLWPLLAICVAAPVLAADIPLRFDSSAKQARYERLLAELRCLVCQNQSLADSNAELAQDLRDEVYTMVDAGGDEDTVIEFMVDRYGDFVRYRPPVKATTIALWSGPFVLLCVGAVMVLLQARGRDTESTLSEDERHRVNSLIGRDEP